MRPISLLLLLLCCSSILPVHPAQLKAQTIIELYPEGIPCANVLEDKSEIKPDIGRLVTGVHTPLLQHYAPVNRMATGAAIMIIPGGGYVVEAWDLEGVDIGNRFTNEGLHVFILQHRLPRNELGECRSHVALDDARRGVQTIRLMADSLGIDPTKVAVMGFSAGGHLSGSAAIHPIAGDSTAFLPVLAYSSQPNASLLIYPVTIIDDSNVGHSGSAVSLLGENYLTSPLRDYYNLPAQIHHNVPPTFLVHASNDKSVPPANALRYYSALVEKDIPASLHIFANGGHGFGSGKHLDGPVSNWLSLAVEWLGSLGF